MRGLKKALRAQMKTVVGALPPEEIHRQSVQVAQRLPHCPWWAEARRVGVYISFAGEVETMDLIVDLLGRKVVDPEVQLFVPYIENAAESSMAFLEVTSEHDLRQHFRPNKWGILEPLPETIPARRNVVRDGVALDAMLVPGAAFDRRGGRCGRGRGYYDRFLGRLRALIGAGALPRMPVLAGLSLEEQLVDEVPMDETDVFLDYVLCPSGVFEAPNGGPLLPRDPLTPP